MARTTFDGVQFQSAGFDVVQFVGFAGFRRVQFSGDVRFKGAHFGGGTGFIGAQFRGNARFEEAQFRGNVGFEGAKFSGDARFSRAQFSLGTTFDGVQFRGFAGFGGAHFGEDAGFEGARFSGHAQFDGVKFSGDAGFHGVQFGGDAGLHGAQFRRDAGFDGAQFTGEANFTGAQFEAATKLGPLTARTLVLAGVVFSRSVVVEAEAGWVSCNRARFDEGVTLRVRHATADLQQVSFGGPSSLEGQPQPFWKAEGEDRQIVQASEEQLQGWDTRATRYRERARAGGSGSRVEEWVPGLMSLQGTDVSELVLTDVDLRWCRFAGGHHLDKLRVEGRSPFHRPPPGWHAGRAWPPVWRWTSRQVLAEEHAWRRRRPGGKAAGWKSYPVDDQVEVGPERLAVLYRSLRKALEDGKDEAGAGDFYYGEMEARRHVGTLRDRIVLTAYWLVSGYGQRALRAVAGLAVLVAAITVLLVGCGLQSGSSVQLVTGTLSGATVGGQTVTVQVSDPPAALPPPEQRWTWGRTGKAVQIALGSVVFRDGGQKLTPCGTWTVMAGRFLGPVLLALAVLAIRARVKR
jgi:uncharacterized protein YjbI with pentapeptide repeats